MKRAIRFLLTTTLSLTCLWAQKTGTTTTGTTTTTTTTGGTSGSTITAPTVTAPVAPAPTTTPATIAPRPIFLSGKVMTDDGSPLPRDVNIQSVCGMQQRNVAHPGSSGDFGFQWADSASVMFQDASESSRGFSGSSLGSTSSTSSATAPSRMNNPMSGCDLQASVSGYTSSKVGLYDRGSTQNFDVGTIVLHRITGDEGRTVSALALKAPKDAKKNFDKGTSLAAANKPADAEASFQKAVAVYPQYADAWLGLGRVESLMGAKDAARSDFQKAMDLDDKMVGPWQELGYLASDQSRWEDAAKYLDHATKLDPMDSPKTWYFNAVANYNLGRFDLAERSLRAEMKLDKNPRAAYLLGLVLIARKDLAGGSDALRNYVSTWPNGEDVESARKQLSRLESQNGK